MVRIMFYQRQLTLEEMKVKAPSIFAENASEKVSSKYLYIPTAKIVDGLIKADFIPVAAKQVAGRTKKDHSKHVIHFLHRSMENRFNGSEEFPLIRLQNSHDGLSSYQIDTGFFRVACSNGIVMPGTQINSARIRHSLGNEKEVIEASYRILNSFDNELSKVSAMKGVQLLPEEKLLLAESASRIVFEEKVIEQNKKFGMSPEHVLLSARRSVDQKNDLWTTFNVIQENAIKGGRRVISENGQYRKMREVKSIDREKQINVELMLLAQKMAALKGAAIAA